MNQIVCKVAPAIAAGCTMVLKPSEICPLSAYLFTEILHQAGVPAGVFNMVNGDGPTVGSAIASHPDVAMVSFTGSTRAGVAVASAAASTVKRVTQELGGKSANILLDDADFEKGVYGRCPRMLSQQRSVLRRAESHARSAVEDDRGRWAAKQAAAVTKVGDPFAKGTNLGPLASAAQFEKVQLRRFNLRRIRSGGRMTGNSEVMQTLEAAAFGRMPLGRPSPTTPALATPSTAA
jgi:aldehyde dehydrogenase (NAD+)